MIIPPPKTCELLYGYKLVAGNSFSTVIADFDFETYSEAGFVWDTNLQKWGALPNAKKKGISIVGAARYTEDKKAEVLCMAYDLKDGKGPRLWKPGDPNPQDLFNHLAAGRLLEAWNAPFEQWVWTNICIPKYGWPQLPLLQLRCAAAKSRAFALPSSLAKAGEVLKTSAQKDKDGTRLLNKFSIPRNPTIKNKKLRNFLQDDPEDAHLLYNYNLQDIKAEADISGQIPDLDFSQQSFWQADLQINMRGVAIDTVSIDNCINIIEQVYKKLNNRLCLITDGKVMRASEGAKLISWINSVMPGSNINSVNAETVESLLKQKLLPPHVREAVEIRSLTSSAAVKKLYSMKNQVCKDGRLHDLFIYHSARTGRAAGSGPQPQNLPNSGPMIWKCGNPNCIKHYGSNLESCPWCGVADADLVEWDIDAVENALEVINTCSLPAVEMFFNDAISTVSGCLRGLFIAAPGHDLICSDYSAIEAVVLAELAGESWRQEVFRTHGKIYEMSASKITGVPFEDFEKYKQENGTHHPLRKKVGKVAELASGYQGWIGAWKAFGAEEFFNGDEIKNAILAWRAASPAIVEFWGGQYRNWMPEYYGVEGCAIQAVINPNTVYSYRGIEFFRKEDALYCKLLSGRTFTYHRPRLSPATPPREGLSLSYEGWNSNPKHGPIGWIRMPTYGGKLTENIVQGTSFDILAYAILNLHSAGYPVVMHVHDEVLSEVLKNFGSIEEFEKIMSTMPPWAKDWPVRASGGWRGKRYRK